MRLTARPLDPASFARFGQATERPLAPAGTVVAALPDPANLRPGRATPRLGWFAVAASPWPVRATQMERHRLSSQSFVPCQDTDWLVLVALADAAGGPDMAGACAFVADGRHAVTFHPDIWHHPLTAFAPARFAVLTCLAGDSEDEEFRSLAEPIEVRRPDDPER